MSSCFVLVPCVRYGYNSLKKILLLCYCVARDTHFSAFIGCVNAYACNESIESLSFYLLPFCSLQFTPNFYKFYFSKADETSVATILKYMKSLEAVISQYGGPFILGKEISTVDLMIWPWFERIRVMADVVPGAWIQLKSH